MKTGAYTAVLERVMATPGVRGALVVAVRDGLIVDGRVHVGVHGAAVAALSAALYRRAGRAAESTGAGKVEFVELDAEEGRVVIAGDNELAVMAVLERRASPGRARLSVRRAAADIAGGEGASQE